ncbi:hypothetical protein Slin15195_G032240 [Septoria linicola]|uniref:Uncharacterized protein n=1 Tax=Septoria linicola TaxID=215465 RepID=A0A9Q9EGE6_9PEZI|nr:hypothetical protein Slin14017_G031260 [Septoria linicola]USW49905.1 hypothetical protein Slin15195_G032240 [Septoria linicola]
MDPTTLVTFLFRSPAEVRTVELLGSWDNFEIPYRMHHDRLRGGLWSGCFKFENIIYDGEKFQWTKPRTGGLKQGGTYWYYYRLNYDLDAYDDRQPHTTACPLLPGQAVNVMEVPTEIVEPPTRCHSAYGQDILGNLTKFTEQKTLDPADKYAAVAPRQMSKVHSRCLSDDQLDGRLEGQPRITVNRAVSPVSPPASRRGSHRSRGSVRMLSRNSAVSSLYSQHSSTGVAPRANNITGERNSHAAQPQTSEGKVDDDGPNQFFEYPDILGTAPLGSLDALGAVLFASSSSCLPVETGYQSEADCNSNECRRDSTFSCGPASVQNVQFYGSRPGTSLGQDVDTYQPRTYSLPNSSISDGSPAASPSVANFPALTNHEFLDCAQEDLYEGALQDGEVGALELVSPTFTATTVSTGGNNTPYRLSAQYDDEDTIVDDSHTAKPDEPESLLPREEGVSSGRTSLLERGLARLRPTFNLNYSLPSLSSDSNQSLAKTITRSSPRVSQEEALQLPLPALNHEEGSMADDIFSELGFLSSSIT